MAGLALVLAVHRGVKFTDCAGQKELKGEMNNQRDLAVMDYFCLHGGDVKTHFRTSLLKI